MGCTVSSLERKNKVGDRGGSTKLTNISMTKTSEENGNAKFDPRLPLTVRQRFNIMKSWKGIARNIQETGVLMFMRGERAYIINSKSSRLFETNDEVKAMFTKVIKNFNVADLRESKELENHVKQVMYTLDEAISSLEDVDFVVNMLHSVGKGHVRMYSAGFNPTVFWKIEEPFLMAVKETLGDRYSANMEHIYRKTIKFILETLMEGFNSE